MGNKKEIWEIVDSQSKSSVDLCGFIGKYQLMYDSMSKAYLISLNCATLNIPKNPDSFLDIEHSNLIFQVFLFQNVDFCLEIVVADSENCQRKIIIDCKKQIFRSPLAARLPNLMFYRGTWLNLSLDIESIFSFCFPNCEFKKISSVTIWGTMFIRKIIAVSRFLQDYTKNVLFMDRVDVAFQEINRNSFIDIKIQNSPRRGCDLRISPRDKSPESPTHSLKNLKSGYIKTLWKIPKEPFNYRNSFEGEDNFGSKYKHSSSVKAHKKLHEKQKSKNELQMLSPSHLDKLDHKPKLNFFQMRSCELLKGRHVTPPFVNTRKGLMYNQLEKKYNNL